jgi:hypothetical protein
MLPDDPRCVFSSQVEPEALQEILRALDPKEITELGCRVIKQPGACALCVANDDCNKVPMHNHCRCKPEFFLMRDYIEAT